MLTSNRTSSGRVASSVLQSAGPEQTNLKLLISDARLREAEWLRLAVALSQSSAPKEEVDAAYMKALAAGAVKNALLALLTRPR
jgi:hypothetical protein